MVSSLRCLTDTNVSSGSSTYFSTTARRISRATSSTKRGLLCFVDDIEFVRPLEQGIVFRTHGTFDKVDQVLCLHVLVCTNQQCCPSSLIVCGQWCHI